MAEARNWLKLTVRDLGDIHYFQSSLEVSSQVALPNNQTFHYLVNFR